MIGTGYSKEHALWDQYVRKEVDAKKRFEFMTGETTAKKFYNGTLRNSVDKRLTTYDNKFLTVQAKKKAKASDLHSQVSVSTTR